MGPSWKTRYVLVACLLFATVGLQSARAQSPAVAPPPLPTLVPVSELEVRLDRDTGGGCFGRSVHYRVTIRGDGTVIYEDLADPPVAARQRVVAADDVLGLVNEFIRARFFDASDRYVGSSFYVRQNDQLLLRGSGGADGPSWDLSLRLGRLAKTVHLYLGYPEYLAKLRDRVDQLGGPQAWVVK